MKKLRIAICFSGQLRTWYNCTNGWLSLIEKISTTLNAEVDIFCHTWDYNGNPQRIRSGIIEHNRINNDNIDLGNFKISEEEIENFKKIMNPISFKIEGEESNINKENETFKKFERINQNGKPIIHWSSAQYYSLMMSSFLKKKYEIENGFKYDICFKMRYDLFFDNHQINYFISQSEDLNIPKYNTINSCHCSHLKIGDIFWYSDSLTFDRVTDFYRWIPTFSDRCFPNRKYILPENVLFFYIKMLKININPLKVDPKIFRFDNLLDVKKKLGWLVKLENYEEIQNRSLL